MKNFKVLFLLSLKLLLLVSIAFAQCNTAAPKVITLTFNGGEVWRPNDAGTFYNIKGGDTLRIPSGTYSLLDLGNFKGDPCRPVVIINYGGQVVIDKIQFRNDAAYFKLTGTGVANIKYGIKVVGAGGVGIGIGLANHVEVCNVEVTNPDVGFFFKINPDPADPRTLYPNYVMNKFYIHDNYLHNIHGEGMYIGHSAPNGDGTTNSLIPIRMDSVEISYNIVDGTDWDGIQLTNARNGAKIHHNTVSNYGRVNLSSQQGGILMGSNVNGDIYNNKVSLGSGNGIQCFGYGNICIYNNTLENVGDNKTTSGQQSIFSNDYVITVEKNAKQKMNISTNYFGMPKPLGAIKVQTDNNNFLPSNINANKLCLTNPPANWQSLYIIAPTGSVITNNVLNCTNTLPLTFKSLNAKRISDTQIQVDFEVFTDVQVTNYYVKISLDGVNYRTVKVIDGTKWLYGNTTYSVIITQNEK